MAWPFRVRGGGRGSRSGSRLSLEHLRWGREEGAEGAVPGQLGTNTTGQEEARKKVSP